MFLILKFLTTAKFLVLAVPKLEKKNGHINVNPRRIGYNHSWVVTKSKGQDSSFITIKGHLHHWMIESPAPRKRRESNLNNNPQVAGRLAAAPPNTFLRTCKHRTSMTRVNIWLSRKRPDCLRDSVSQL